MVQARFSWGYGLFLAVFKTLMVCHSRYYGTIIPSILNVLSLEGFLVVNTIVGGQTLAEVSDHLDATLGIVIIAIISLIVCSIKVLAIHAMTEESDYQITFCGCQVLHW